ncbi:serine/threonine-protein kinase [Spirochaeta lutea]|uniref:serine/threonine-protein kinase n=1 Tax=Spirochaeta lutea TaxID=1480694 RepID=UPI00068B883E|nr:serine/threonine-protein kinase [Spirochaeta lutea]
MAQIPESIGKYKVQSLIARGGMGEVFKAEHPTLGRPVVIKRLTMRGNPGVVERFRREAQIMIDFKSEYIVDVFDHFREGSWYHIVQEYIDGISLDALIERERYLPEHIALPIFLAACRALDYAHARGVVHRDIKPGNILISRSGQVKLVDFGIASVRGGEGEAALTQDGMTLGTPSYMAPEQFHSSRTVDARADIYSLGVLLYEAVTGKKPFPGSFTPETLQLIQRGRYRAPARVNPRVSPFVNRLIKKAMHARKNRRFSTLRGMMNRVEQYLGTRESHKRPQEYAPLIASYLADENPPPPRRPASITKLVTVSLLVVGVLGLVSMLFYRGYHRGLLFPSRYGGVSMVIQVPRQYELPGSLPGTIQGQLIPLGLNELGSYQPETAGDPGVGTPPEASAAGPDSGAGAEDLQEGRARAIPVHLGGRPGADGGLEFVSALSFVPAGDYTLQVGVGEGLVVRSLRILPRREAGWNQRVRFQLPEPEPAVLEIVPRVRDGRTGIILSRDARITLLKGGMSGEDLELLIQMAGYFSSRVELSTLVGQRRVIIDASLEPRPGTVRVSWPGAGNGRRQLVLNGSSRYLEGGRDPEFRRIPALEAGGELTLVLAPGTYTLGYQEDGGFWEQVFTLEPTQRIDVVLAAGRN